MEMSHLNVVGKELTILAA